ncbi:hypothetical protein [Foetidibacter luteolus]|uniref:hypothetical protein n=1 Tax=Foetidibacter luteolus TaxID=2608880 RepID=UPI00129B1E8D|nr:hypothetical protein [Foetidibacter luteolus]
MTKAYIKLAIRQIIDASSHGSFEKDVFNDTYHELLMQAQAYNPGNKLSTFKDLIDNNPKANSLHYKVGFCIGLYVQELNNIVPGITDTLNRVALPFETAQFQIVESSLINKQQHKIALTYTSGTLSLHAVIGDALLLSSGENHENSEAAETFLLQLQPSISICSFKEAHTITA